MADDLMAAVWDIECTDSPPAAQVRALSRGIVEFNRRVVPDLEAVEDERRFHVLLRNDAARLCGGLRAACFWNTLHIELLWLAEAARGLGLGARIVDAAQARARQYGMANAWVETTRWQARPFYEKQGYVCTATVPDRPRGHTSFYLHKRLRAPA